MVNIVRKITDVNRDSALSALIEADWNIKAAIIMVLNPMSLENAKNILALCNGNLRCALSKFKK